MSPNQAFPAPASTSSEPTVTSSPSEALLELGRALIKELGLDESNDTLGRWMAHHIAELIRGVEEARPDEKAEKARICREAILDLWRHRHIKIHGRPIFDQLDPILRVLVDLDSDNERPRHLYSIRSKIRELDVDEQTGMWLQRAAELDNAARLLVGFFINRAASSAVRQTETWVQMAEDAGLDEDPEFEIYRVLRSRIGQSEPSHDARDRQRAQRHIRQLEDFTKTALELIDELRDQEPEPENV